MTNTNKPPTPVWWWDPKHAVAPPVPFGTPALRRSILPPAARPRPARPRPLKQPVCPLCHNLGAYYRVTGTGMALTTCQHPTHQPTTTTK